MVFTPLTIYKVFLRISDVLTGLAGLENMSLVRIDMHFHNVIYVELDVRFNIGDEPLPGLVCQANVCPDTQGFNCANGCRNCIGPPAASFCEAKRWGSEKTEKCLALRLRPHRAERKRAPIHWKPPREPK